jgi:diaminopimelate decarboxylase
VNLPDCCAFERGVLTMEDMPLDQVAQRFGTPCYVYSRKFISDAFLLYKNALGERPGLVCYAVKANSNLAILDVLNRLGAGFDIVSGGELSRVLAAGGRADRVIFSGVGKSSTEIEQALKAGIRCFNVESTGELERLNQIASRASLRVPVSLRVNPDVDARTHRYISTGLKESKFGIAYGDAFATYQLAAGMSHLDVVGIDCHIGSQLLDTEPLFESLARLCELVDRLDDAGIALKHLDLGGGVGVQYHDEKAIAVDQFVSGVLTRIDQWRSNRYHARPIEVLFEPGRSVVANAGVLLTRVEYLKQGAKNFAVVDAAMNDLLRPALYDAWHGVVNVTAPGQHAQSAIWDVVGPVCESGDWLARQRELTLAPGDLLAILSAGAYAMSMASNYNTRGRPAEVMVDRTSADLIRERESAADCFALERLAPW